MASGEVGAGRGILGWKVFQLKHFKMATSQKKSQWRTKYADITARDSFNLNVPFCQKIRVTLSSLSLQLW